MIKTIMTLILIIFLICIFQSGFTYAKEIKRIALIVGNNDGGQERIKLKYAISDAEALAKVISEIGDFDSKDVFLLKETNRKVLIYAFSKIKKLIKQYKNNSQRVEFLFYYSGHSDDICLKLGNDTLNYKELKTLIKKLNAHVQIVILDSCASGALLSIRGGKRVSPFLGERVNKMEGHAYITSSSVDEYAQESELLKAGFFTHYLISGLRGAADYSKDRKVTLNEAYQFAFEKTLSHSSQTMGGPQHPGYDIRLIGVGELILTDLRKASSSLLLAKDINGHIIIKNKTNNSIIETDKKMGDPAIIALEAGSYNIIVRNKNDVKQADFKIARGNDLNIESNNLLAFNTQKINYRGDEKPVDADISIKQKDKVEVKAKKEDKTPSKPANDKVTDVEVSFFSPYQLSGPEYDVEAFRFNGIYGENNNVNGIDLTIIGARTHGNFSGISLAWIFNIVDNDNTTPLQMVSIYNYVGNHNTVTGLQFVDIVNYCDNISTIKGLGFTGIYNYARNENNVFGIQLTFILNNTSRNNINGFQLAGILNLSDVSTINGFQMAGLLNISTEETIINGFQLAGIMNYSSTSGDTTKTKKKISEKEDAKFSINAFQLACVTNIVDNDLYFHGFQMSVCYNYANKMTGAQFGLVNHVNYMKGIQIGLFNYTEHMKGLQIGLVNVIWTNTIPILPFANFSYDF